jgi:translation initiation factor 5
MTTINISNANKASDPFYRYKMPALEITNEGKGKKTALINITAVADAIKRPVSCILPFFQIKFGTNVIFDKKENKAFINGIFPPKSVQDYLQQYVEQFVLCGKCQNPETVITISKKGVKYTCQACGHSDIYKESKESKQVLKNMLKEYAGKVKVV